jgi:hypothetical protein
LPRSAHARTPRRRRLARAPLLAHTQRAVACVRTTFASDSSAINLLQRCLSPSTYATRRNVLHGGVSSWSSCRWQQRTCRARDAGRSQPAGSRLTGGVASCGVRHLPGRHARGRGRPVCGPVRPHVSRPVRGDQFRGWRQHDVSSVQGTFQPRARLHRHGSS